MYSHNMIGTNDIEQSKAFYDTLFASLGAEPGVFDDKGRVMYFHGGGIFVITKPINGEPATVANGNTIGFAMDTPEQADKWHGAGVAAGGAAIEDAPGMRTLGGRQLYLAYLRDPDGHKLCALKWMD